MPLTSLERQAAFAAAAKLNDLSKVDAAKQLGVSWTHVRRGLADPAQIGAELDAKILAFIAPVAELGERVAEAVLQRSA